MPLRSQLYVFFEDRQWHPRDFYLSDAVAKGLELQNQTGKEFVWLCVTNAGAARVNEAALSLFDLPLDRQVSGYPIDPNQNMDLDF